MIKRISATVLTIFTLFFMTSCQLAKEENNHTSKQSSSDKLVGVFITTESIGLSGGRIDAKLTTVTHTDPATGKVSEIREYVFESIKGITCIAAEVPHTETEDSFLSTGSDEAVCDRHLTVNVGDNEGIDMKGSIYLTPSMADRPYYINPVYQSTDGSVYAVQGTNDHVSGGGSLSYNLNETNTVTENGNKKSVCFNADISINVMLPPSNIVVLQMDKDSTILLKQAYTPGKQPYNITPDAGTSYIIVETHTLDLEGKPAVSYELYNKDSKFIKTFYCREDGVCIQKLTALNWSKR